MLELSGISKCFGGVRTLEAIELSIRPGEFFSLLGPSGCGKTTLLRIVAGLETLDQGRILLGGVDIHTKPPYQREFNMVFQRYALFPHLDVGRNVAFGLRVKGLARAETERRVEEALALVSMSGFMRREVQTLSGGQQQRVAIARAIVNRPKVLLLDEPLSALDLKLRERMQVELLALQRRLNMTFLYVTHAQDEALTLSDRIAVMNGGRVEQVGTPASIYDQPETPFVATFIGQINRIPGRLLGIEGEEAVVDIGQAEPVRGSLAKRQSPTLAKGTNVTVLIRPERLSAETGAGVSNRIKAVVQRTLFKGDHLEVLVEAKGLSAPIPLCCHIPRGAGAMPEPGATLALAWRSAKALVMTGEMPP